MAKLWLTYAWKDHRDQDVDHVVGELKKVGLDVSYDRVHIIPGQRLWPQIDKGIADPSTDAWAILVTANSLNSEPCMEELAYALDRALRTRGVEFPLIGIFPAPVDRELIPSAIAARLYVNLQQTNWAQLVADGVNKRKPAGAPSSVPPLVAKFHRLQSTLVLEVRPRTGRWYPCVIAVPKGGTLTIASVLPGPSGSVPGTGTVSEASGDSPDKKWSYVKIGHAVDALNSVYISFKEEPHGKILVGQNGEMYSLNLDALPK